MKIGWWAEVSITPDTFVFGTPNNHLPLIKEAIRRDHDVRLIHIPWKADGKYVIETGARCLRMQEDLDAAIKRRKAIEDIVKTNSGLDATMRTFDAARTYCSRHEPDELPYDVVFMKLPPPGFLRTKLEVVYNMWRFCKAGVPVFCFDGDLMWDQAVEWFEAQPWEQNFVHARTAYVPKKALPQHKWWPYFYDPVGELPVQAHRKIFDLGYVGNDWKQEGSPRAEGLGKFYGRSADAVWGRWTESNQDLTMIPKPMFFGPIPANQVHSKYAQCRASVILGLPGYYKTGLVTQRYREVLQAGCLGLPDAAYGDFSAPFFMPQYRVKDYDDVRFWLELAHRDFGAYVEHVQQQRDWVKNNHLLRLERWIDELETLAGRQVKT